MELEAENWRSTTLVRGVSGELEDENWRICSRTLARSNLWSWKLRTGDFVVQLEYAEYLGSWKMRTGDFLVQL